VSHDAVGRRYARAIFDIGKEEGNVAALADQLRSFAEAYEASTELQTVLESPLVAEDARTAIVLEVATRTGAGPTVQKALRLITRQRRLPALPDIARHLERFVDADAKVVRAEVMSAGPLDDAYLAKLRTELEKATGQKVVVSHRVDAALLGGIVTKIGDRVIDGSLRSRLKGFKEAALN